MSETLEIVLAVSFGILPSLAAELDGELEEPDEYDELDDDGIDELDDADAALLVVPDTVTS